MKVNEEFLQFGDVESVLREFNSRGGIIVALKLLPYLKRQNLDSRRVLLPLATS